MIRLLPMTCSFRLNTCNLPLIGSGRAAARQVVLAARPVRLARSYPAVPMFPHYTLPLSVPCPLAFSSRALASTTALIATLTGTEKNSRLSATRYPLAVSKV